MFLTGHLTLPRLLHDIGPPLLPAEALTVRQNASHSRCYASFPEHWALGVSCPRVTDTKAEAFAVRELTAGGYQTQPAPEPGSVSQPEWAGRWEQHLLWQNTGCCRSPWMAHQRRRELAGGAFWQPTQEAAVILTASSAAPDQTASSTSLLASLKRFAEQSTHQFRRRCDASTGKAVFLRPS